MGEYKAKIKTMKPAAAALRLEIESALANRIPAALTPVRKETRPVAPTGVAAVDALVAGGLPVGAITEMAGPESSGRTSLACSFVAEVTRAGQVAAWIDVCDALDPESAAAAGVELPRLLWVRCGVGEAAARSGARQPWTRMEQGLRVADLLLQAGGFRAIVLDMAGLRAEYSSRAPLATWFRYRAAAERTQTCLLLLTQHPCAKSSAELLLRFRAGQARGDEATVFTGMEYALSVERRRFSDTTVIPLRMPPRSAGVTEWRSQAAWAGPR